MPTVASDELTGLPAAYWAWRASELGRITDSIEQRLVLELVGPVADKRVLERRMRRRRPLCPSCRGWWHLTGLDADAPVLAAARERISTSGAAIAFVEGDARSLPFADDSFDVVVAVTILCFVADAEQAVKEIARVLRPGGRLVIGELGRTSLWAAKRRLSGWLGSTTWRAALFRTARELKRLATAARLDVDRRSWRNLLPAVQSLRTSAGAAGCPSRGRDDLRRGLHRSCRTKAHHHLYRGPHDQVPDHRPSSRTSITTRPRPSCLRTSCARRGGRRAQGRGGSERLRARSGRRHRAADQSRRPRTSAILIGPAITPSSTAYARGHGTRHRAMCGRRTVRRPHRRAAVRIGLPAADQHHFIGAARRAAPTALLHS